MEHIKHVQEQTWLVFDEVQMCLSETWGKKIIVASHAQLNLTGPKS